MDPQAPLKNPDKKTPILSGAKGKKQSRNQMAGELGFFMKQPEISSLGNYGGIRMQGYYYISVIRKDFYPHL
jgi:hypothetical protein